MSRFFMLTGVLMFVALAFCFSGILQHMYFGTFVPSRPYTSAAMTQLLNYDDWNAFGKNCCCMEEEKGIPLLSLLLPPIASISTSSLSPCLHHLI